MDLFAPGHLIPLLIIAGLLFFGWKQLPDMAKSAGRSLRVFRHELKGLSDDISTTGTDSNTVNGTVAPTQSSAFPAQQEASSPVSPLPPAIAAPAEAAGPDVTGKTAG